MTSYTFAQDAQFSQYYASGLYLNPALAGAENNLTFSSNYRNQWKGLVIPYVTSQLSMIAPLRNKSLLDQHVGGIGLSAYFDRAGDGNFKTTGFNANFAYNIPISYNRDHIVTFGLQAGFVQKSVDPTNLNWGEQYNPYIGYDATVVPSTQNIVKYNIIYPDFGAGLIYYYNSEKQYSKKSMSGFIGFSIYHLNSPDESLVQGITSTLPKLYKIHGGIEVKLTPKLFVSPNFLVASQNSVNQINVGSYLTYRVFNQRNTILAKTDMVAGAWYRVNDSFIFSLGIDNDAYTIGFSYDMNASQLGSAIQSRSLTSVSAYELSLAVRKITEKKLRRFSTPRI